jgi:hypothetical protein
MQISINNRTGTYESPIGQNQVRDFTPNATGASLDLSRKIGEELQKSLDKIMRILNTSSWIDVISREASFFNETSPNFAISANITSYSSWDIGVIAEPDAEYVLFKEPVVQIAVANTVTALRHYFQNHEIVIRKNNNPLNPQKIHIMVTASEEIDPELDLLERFDLEWWINQDPGLAMKVLVRLR